jgi:hypothetical protein
LLTITTMSRPSQILTNLGNDKFNRFTPVKTVRYDHFDLLKRHLDHEPVEGRCVVVGFVLKDTLRIEFLRFKKGNFELCESGEFGSRRCVGMESE